MEAWKEKTRANSGERLVGCRQQEFQEVGGQALQKLRVQPTHSEMGKLRSQQGKYPGHTELGQSQDANPELLISTPEQSQTRFSAWLLGKSCSWAGEFYLPWRKVRAEKAPLAPTECCRVEGPWAGFQEQGQMTLEDVTGP